MDKEPIKEQFDFEGCDIKTIENNGKLAIGIQHSHPMGLIALCGFIDILGKPEGFTYKNGDYYVLFLFNADNKKSKSIEQLWQELSQKCEVK
jgi:hypothetical protein